MADLYQIEREPDAETVHYLEDLLARAKTGEVQGFAICIHKSRAATANGWVNVPINCMALIGEIEAMKVDIIRSKVEQRYDCCGDFIDE